jgi:hypothetical protein
MSITRRKAIAAAVGAIAGAATSNIAAICGENASATLPYGLDRNKIFQQLKRARQGLPVKVGVSWISYDANTQTWWVRPDGNSPAFPFSASGTCNITFNHNLFKNQC